MAAVWGVRKAGLGLLMSMKGDMKPVPFIEDAAVPVECLPEDSRAYVVTLASGYCDEAHRDETSAFFKERSAAFNGGPRFYNGVMESIDLCIQFRARQQKSATAFLEKSAAAKKSAAGAAR